MRPFVLSAMRNFIVLSLIPMLFSACDKPEEIESPQFRNGDVCQPLSCEEAFGKEASRCCPVSCDDEPDNPACALTCENIEGEPVACDSIEDKQMVFKNETTYICQVTLACPMGTDITCYDAETLAVKDCDLCEDSLCFMQVEDQACECLNKDSDAVDCASCLPLEGGPCTL